MFINHQLSVISIPPFRISLTTFELLFHIFKVSVIHAVEHGVSHALSHTLGHSIAYAVTAGAAQAGGGAVHFAVAGAMAAQESKHIRDKEKEFKKSRGLKGLTSTRANKDITKTWTGALAGSGGSLAVGLGVYYGAVRFLHYKLVRRL